MALGVCVFCVAFGVRLAYVLQARQSPAFECPLMDAAYHDRWARQIAGGDWLGDEVFFRAPLYPYFLGTLYTIVGPNYLAVRAVQAVIGATTCLLVYVTGLWSFGLWVGVIAGVVCALYGPMVYFDGELLLPVLETFFGAGMLAALAWGLRPRPALEGESSARPALAPWLLVGVCGGLFALTRPNILAVIPVLVGYGLYRSGLQRGWRAAASCLGVVTALILPVMVRNYVVGQDLVPIASQAGVNLYIGNNPRSDGITAVVPGTRATWWGGYRDAIAIAERAEGHKLKPSEVSAYWTRRAVGFAVSQPGVWARLLLRKTFLFWYSYELPNNAEIYPAGWFSPVLSALLWSVGPLHFPFGLLAPLALVGLALTARDRESAATPLALYVLVYSLTVIAFFVCSRYRIPVIPALALLAAYALVQAPRLLRLHRRDVPALCVLGVFALSLLLNWDVYRVGKVDLAKAHQDLAACYQQKGQYAEAEAEYGKALQANPADIEVRLGLALCLISAGEYGRAEEMLREVLARFRERWEAVVGMGDALAGTGRLQEASEYYRRAIKIDPRGAEAYARLGEVLGKLGRKQEAEAALAQAPADASGNEMVQLGQARLAFEAKDYARVVALCREALRKAPDSVKGRALLAAALANTGQQAEASRIAAEVLQDDPEQVEALTVLGQGLLAQNRPRQAIAALKRATEVEPKATDAWALLGTTLALQGDLSGAQTACRRALELDPDNVQVRFALAGCLFDAGKPGPALDECRAILAKRPDFAPAQGLMDHILRSSVQSPAK